MLLIQRSGETQDLGWLRMLVFLVIAVWHRVGQKLIIVWVGRQANHALEWRTALEEGGRDGVGSNEDLRLHYLVPGSSTVG